MTDTSASAGHDDALDTALIERAERLRETDRARWRMFKRVLRWLAILAVPGSCLVAVAIPGITTGRGRCRSQQAEGKGALQTIYVAEQSYRAEFDHYTPDATSLGVQPAQRYRTFVEAAPIENAFVAWAVGTDGAVRGDVWRVDANRTLANARNACER